jgi:serine protease inhibitor
VKFSESAAAAGEINSWVANHTHDKIRDLVTPGKETSKQPVKCMFMNECRSLDYVDI